MIFGVVGTLPFDRFVHMLDDYATHHPSERVVIQTARSNYQPRTAEHFTFESRDRILDLYKQADVVVAHAGMGTIIDVSSTGRLLVLVPRLSRLREHVDDHQIEIAMHLNRACGVPIVEDRAQLENAIRYARPVSFPQADGQLPSRIAEYLRRLERSAR